jgi:hypothetical protein
MTKQEADSLMLSKSEQGKDGMTVVKLGYVRDLLDKLFSDQTTVISVSQVNQNIFDTTIEFYGSSGMRSFDGNIKTCGSISSILEANKLICKIFKNVKEIE